MKACACGASYETDHLALVAGGSAAHPYTGPARSYGSQVEALESATELLDLEVYPDDMGAVTLRRGTKRLMITFAENDKVAYADYLDRATGNRPEMVGGSVAEIIAVMGEIARA